MTDVIIILESSYLKGDYYRVDFFIDSIRRSGLSSRLYACGSTSDIEGQVDSREIRLSKLLRLLNVAAYLLTLRSFAHFGHLLGMWPALTHDRPDVIIFYRYWTGLFLLFWRKLTGCRSRLVWEWYDLDTRMHYYRRKMRLSGRIMLRLEERIAPRHFQGLVVPTKFACHLLQTWGHRGRKIHVLGEVRELNPFVDDSVLKRRVEEISNGGPLRIVWVGVIRHYQLEGLRGFFRALRINHGVGRPMVVHIVGPAEKPIDELTHLGSGLPSDIEVEWHGSLPVIEMDRILAEAHMAIHPMPNELFCDYIYTRKLSDYLAASLPVAFSRVEGLREVGDRFGASFNLGDPSSVADTLAYLSAPHKYRTCLSQAWEVAHEEYSDEGLTKKGDTLVSFLRGLTEQEPPEPS